MKKKIYIMLVLLIYASLYVLADTSVVRLKSGAEVKGTIISFNPSSEIVLDVGGFEPKINMADVEIADVLEKPYIPTNVRSIGKDAFQSVSSDGSYRGFFPKAI